MKNSVVFISLFLSIVFLPRSSQAIISSCNQPCQTTTDCEATLICTNGRCDDDPTIETQQCLNTCRPIGTFICRRKSFPRFKCSPPVTSSTRAILTNDNDFSRGGDYGGPSECDGKFHENSEHIVALSTGWYNKGSRCGKMIKIRAENGRTALAKVVDECDSLSGCEEAQLPCRNNIVDGSDAVWKALGLDVDAGEQPITWMDA